MNELDRLDARERASPKAVGDIFCIMARYSSAGYKDPKEEEVGLSGPTHAWLLGPAAQEPRVRNPLL